MTRSVKTVPSELQSAVRGNKIEVLLQLNEEVHCPSTSTAMVEANPAALRRHRFQLMAYKRWDSEGLHVGDGQNYLSAT